MSVSLLVVTTGCERTPLNAEHAKAQDTFDTALGEVKQGLEGVRELKAEDRRVYRQAQLEQASKTLAPVLQNVKPTHVVAARSMKAEQLASVARLSIGDASLAWTREGPTMSLLVSDMSSIRPARTRAAANGAVNYEGILSDLNGKIAQLNQSKQALMNESAPLTKKIEDLKAQMQRNDEARRKKIIEADKYAREAFKSSGKQQFDLHKAANEATREADKRTAQSDRAAANLDIASAQQKIIDARLDDLNLQITQLQEAVTSLQKRQSDTDNLASTATEHAATLLERFDANLQKIATTHQEKVTAVYEKANAAYMEAIDDLDAAAKQAPNVSGLKDTTTLALNATRTEYGVSLYEQSILHTGFSELLKDLSTAATKEVSDRKQTLDEMAAAADKLAAEAAEKAKEALDEAQFQLNDLVEPSAGDKKLHHTVLRQLIEINVALAGITGEDSYKARTEELKNQLLASQTG